MPTNVVVVGVQWGDEGKGKVVDVLAEHFDIVARYQGGANAGHTVLVGAKKYVLQLLPTGIIRRDRTAAIGNGVVVDPEALQQEICKLQEAGASVDHHRLKVSDRAHLILPYHRAHELAAEEARGVGKIGTTAKGIGPAYEDKAGRRGLRACDLRDPVKFREKCQALVEEKNRIDAALFGAPPLNAKELTDQYIRVGEGILPYVADVSVYLNAEMDRGKRVLF
jgi:adenylosuccinate synthase